MKIHIEHLDYETNQWVEQTMELDVDADMSLSEETIDQDMCSLPRTIAYYADLSSELYAQAARHKQHAEVVEARAAQEFRQDTTIKVTEANIKERVTMNLEVIAARNKYFKSDAQYRKLDGFYRALREKASLAIAICYKQKEEIRVMNSPIN